MSIKMLYILNIANRVNSFSYTSMMAAKELGIEYHIAGNWKYENDQERMADEIKYGIHIHHIDFIRAPYHPGNIKAYKQLSQIVDREKFDIIHCNTPIGGVVGRILGKQFKIKTVIYQAHGFHFYKESPLLNWLIYYPIEKWLARYTDYIITINHEDFALASNKFKLRNNGKVYYVPGVGIDLSSIKKEKLNSYKKREELGIPSDAFVIVSVGELNTNKNNRIVLDAMNMIKNKNVHYVLCGEGDQKDMLMKMADNAKLNHNVHFLGYRNDIQDILSISDCFVLPSYREGLSRSLMEAMSIGLPCIVSNIRGNIDLIEDKKGGFLCNTDDVDSWCEAIAKITKDKRDRDIMSIYNRNYIKQFDCTVVIDKIKQIYAKEFI